MAAPSRGEIWLVNFDPVVGHEQAGRRPALVVSDDRFNRSRAGLVIVVPLTTRERNLPSRVLVLPPEGGLRERSFIKCEDIRSVSQERLGDQPWGMVRRSTLAEVETRLRYLLRL